MKKQSYEPKKIKTGFTLIELSLSMIFIGLLSLTIMLSLSSIIAAYRRAMTLDEVNTLGIAIMDDIRVSVQNSSTNSAINACEEYFPDRNSTDRNNCIKNNGLNYITQTRRYIYKGGALSLPIYGIFCTGTYSYLWNSGYYITSENIAIPQTMIADKTWLKLKFKNTLGQTKILGGGDEPFRFIKIRDDRRTVCASNSVNSYKVNALDANKQVVIDISEYGEVAEDPIELIPSQKGGLALYYFSTSTPTESSINDNIFYSISFVLGTIQGNKDITSIGRSCAVPNDTKGADFDYCAINRFNFAVQAVGE